MLTTWFWLATALAQQTPAEAPAEVPAEVPVAPPTDAPGTSPAGVDAWALVRLHEARMQDQEARLQAQQAELDAQQRALEAMSSELAKTRLDLIPDDLKLDWEGHYRLRGYVFNHLYASQGKKADYRDARYVQQRLWLRPVFSYKDQAKLSVEIRALDDVIWGDNASQTSTALFAEGPSNTDLDGQEQPSVEVARAWVEFKIPVGLIRAGRQPADWGMGLLANDGESFDHAFGESHYGTTNDRLLFATRPIAIAQKIAGKADTNVPFILAVAGDRLVEDPLIQYYGYQCTPGLTQGDPDFDPRCDSDGDGVTEQDHSWTDDTRTADQRPADWWVDQGDDVWQMVYVVAYRGEDIDYLGDNGDLNAGVWAVHRKQAETDSDVLIADFYLKANVHDLLLEGELIRISGKTRAITLPDDTGGDPLQKTAGILGYAVRGGYTSKGLKAIVEHGFASGDDRVSDANFTGRPLNPDHNVGLVLYEEVISRVTAALWTDSANGLWSRGGVYNSRYVFPTVHLFAGDAELVGGFVGIWPHKPDGAIIGCNDDDAVECATPGSQQPKAEMLGHEFDFAVKYGINEHVKLTVESGIATATDRLPLEVAGLNPEGKFFTLQSRVAWVF